jgi:hypothetical protein
MLQASPDNIGYVAARRFLRDFPNHASVVHACVSLAEQTNGDFAGAWVLREAQKLGVMWFPNLRSLASYGILRRTDVTRGGRRAYYTMPDIKGVKAALGEFSEGRWQV